ncbi:MAG: alpha-galactosidase [Clostridia bacterium]|nr:alpha-galactosidase [Clostridia bacterium]
MIKLFSAILAVIYFIVTFGGIFTFHEFESYINTLDAKNGVQFESISAEEMNLNNEEKELCENWFESNLSVSAESYPFTFRVDGKKFNADDWIKEYDGSAEFGSVYSGGKTGYLILKNSDESLEATVEATLFPENGACQWTVFIKNTGDGDSAVISDFYAFDSALSTGEALLYYSMGSNSAASDFSLIEKKLTATEKSFSGVNGKPTEKYLPYFNVCGKNFGAVIGVGWTGQWKATFSETNGKTNVTVRQESLKAYLLPGEEIRSPLVSVNFYKNSNPLKGFNLFRKWVTDCVYPENINKNSYTAMQVADPVSTKTSDEIIAILDGIDPSVYEQTDVFWMDAGWYEYNEGWHDGVGTWKADKSRYDNGISELSGYAADKGIGYVLWYEPERVYEGTEFYKVGLQHEDWLIHTDSDISMWNLANEEAFEFFCNYILNSLKENGVTVYRQDFNFAPIEYWEKADKEFYGGRKGICENHYVTNLYRYLDYLTDNIDGLIIDNCASGGKRLDLEMTYRSVPFWRSDYNCSYHDDLFNATQAHTYGLSFWLPIHGSALWMANEYASRSAIMPFMLMDFYSHQHPEFGFYKEQRELMTGNYYPLDFGGADSGRMLAMQFSTQDALNGTALIYKRAEVTNSEYTVKLNGLAPSENYSVYDVDKPETVLTFTGKELMENGITLELPDGEKAIILMFSAE